MQKLVIEDRLFYWTAVVLLAYCHLLHLQVGGNDIGSQQNVYYTAAVVEYAPEGTPWELPPSELIATNVENYKTLIAQASAQDADIIVFPEYGLTTLGIPRERQSSKPFLLRVPPVGDNPCVNADSWSQQVVDLACAAKSNEIYVVVNLGEIRECGLSDVENECPEDGVFHYNTNVVFDRSGTVVAKYEKGNLYFEDQFDKPKPIQLSTFTTDFGVIFGVFTCFDIIFEDPPVRLLEDGVEVRNFVFPTAWVDEFPFLTGVQAQESWAQSVNANLLASGYHQPGGGQMGSGIYSGNQGALNYTFDPESGTRIILAKVPMIPEEKMMALRQPCEAAADGNKIPTDSKKKEGKASKAFHSYLREDLQNYTTKIIDTSTSSLVHDKVCTENGFCCKVEYEMSALKKNGDSSECKTAVSANFRLVAINGTRTVAAKTAEYEWQVCSIVRCWNETLESCSENDKLSELPSFKTFTLSATFDLRESKAFIPGRSLIDVNNNLIPSQVFDTSLDMNLGLMTISSTFLASVDIQTVAMINKFY